MCVCVCVCRHVYVSTDVPTFVCVCVCMCACACLCVCVCVSQVLQQEEETDRAWAQSEGAVPGAVRPRELKKRWREAVEGAADGSLPQGTEAQDGALADYLDRIRVRVVEDLGAAKRNVVPVYPEEYQAFLVYTQSYHQAVAKRLRSITDRQLQITDIYSLLDWLYNIYNR